MATPRQQTFTRQIHFGRLPQRELAKCYLARKLSHPLAPKNRRPASNRREAQCLAEQVIASDEARLA